MPLYTKCSRCGKRIPYGTQCQCKKDKYKEYDRTVRNNKENIIYTKFYKSKEWKHKSKYIKGKYNGLCLMCLLKYNLTIPADVAHHIETLRESWDKRFQDDNLIPLCHGCHKSIDHNNYTEDKKNELRNLLKEYIKFYRPKGV